MLGSLGQLDQVKIKCEGEKQVLLKSAGLPNDKYPYRVPSLIFVSKAVANMIKKEPQCQELGLYLRHFIFFVTYEWAQYVSVQNYARLEGLGMDKHSSLISPFVSYKGNTVR